MRYLLNVIYLSSPKSVDFSFDSLAFALLVFRTYFNVYTLELSNAMLLKRNPDEYKLILEN